MWSTVSYPGVAQNRTCFMAVLPLSREVWAVCAGEGRTPRESRTGREHKAHPALERFSKTRLNSQGSGWGGRWGGAPSTHGRRPW